MADDEVKVRFSLDTQEAIDKLMQLKGSVSSVGDTSSLEGLTSGLLQVGAVAGTLGVAFLALKTTFESVFEAENIKSINTQFGILATQSGIATDTLKEGLKEAANGLIDDTELLQTANKAIMTMGESANKLPEIMELARKSAVVTGKDAKTTFDELTMAISMGNQRMLKHMGIVIDVQAAYRKYAVEIGSTVNALSEAGRRQAVLNEVLDKGGKQLAGVDESVKKATNTWTQFKVTLTEIKDTALLAFEKVAGGKVQGFLSGIGELAKRIKTTMVADMGEGAEQTAAKIEILERKIKGLTSGKLVGEFSMYSPEQAKQEAERLQKTLDGIKLVADLEAQERAKRGDPAKEAAALAVITEANKKKGEDAEKAFAIQTKFEADILNIKKANAAEIGKLALTQSDIERSFGEQRILATAEVAQKIKEIDAQVRLGTMPDEIAAKEKELIQQGLSFRLIEIKRAEAEAINKIRQTELDNILAHSINIEDVERASVLKREVIENNVLLTAEQRALQLNEIENQKSDYLKQILDNNARMADGMWNKFEAGAKQSANTAKTALNNWAQFSNDSIGAFSSNFTSAFTALGQGSIGLGEAMKKAIIGALADIALQKGALLITEGFANLALLNPMGGVMVAGGTALVALGGVMKGIAGAGGGGGIATTGGGGGGGGVASAASTAISSGQEFKPSVEDSTSTKRSVTVQIQGNYFETEQTRTRLVELIRESADATDFRILAVGGGI